MERHGGPPGRRATGLLVLLLFQGVSAVGGGLWLVLHPTGIPPGLTLELLRGSAFGDYRLPGLVLLVVLGVVPCVVAFGLWRRTSWSRIASVLVGGALVVWIVLQITIIGYQPWPPPPWPSLQLVYGTLGIAIVGLAAKPFPLQGTGEER